MGTETETSESTTDSAETSNILITYFSRVGNMDFDEDIDAVTSDDAGSPVYFKKITVTPDDERAWFKTHSQWSKSNKYTELEARIYI